MLFEARRNLYAGQINLAQETMEEGAVERARALLDALRPLRGQEDLRGWEWRYLWRRCQGDLRAAWGPKGGQARVRRHSPLLREKSGIDRWKGVDCS